MKLIGIASLVTALALAAFGVWGCFADAGKARFDEMDGIYPEAALIVAAVVGVVGLVIAFPAARGPTLPAEGFTVVTRSDPASRPSSRDR